jgi:hypothetical protein
MQMMAIYPAVAPDELRNAHGYENMNRVVVTQKGVYGRTNDGRWIELRPLSQGYSSKIPFKPTEEA